MLAFAYQHGYVTARQLQRRFAETIRTPRTAQHQALTLVRHGYLTTAPARPAPVTVPHVYIATAKGVHLVAEAYTAKTGRPWPVATQRRLARGRHLHYLQHETDVTDVDLAILHTAERRGDLQLAATERRYHQPGKRLHYTVGDGTHAIAPDAGYHVIHHRDGRHWLDLCFLELDRGTMAPQRIERKLDRYDQWSTSAAADAYLTRLHRRFGDRHTTRPNFRLLLIARHRPSEGVDFDRLATLFTRALGTSRPMRQRLWLATFDDLLAHRDDPLPLAAPIWLRVRDAGRWLDEFRRHAAGLSGDPFANYQQKLFVAERLADLPRYALFPPAHETPVI